MSIFKFKNTISPNCNIYVFELPTEYIKYILIIHKSYNNYKHWLNLNTKLY